MFFLWKIDYFISERFNRSNYYSTKCRERLNLYYGIINLRGEENEFR